jgi:C1A family cysteine protease
MRILSILIGCLFLATSVWAEPLKINELQKDSAKKGWTAKENKISKLTDVQKKKRLGLKGHGVKMPKTPMKALKALKALPTSLDYRTQGYVSSIKDQGDCGSCWAFAATGVLESATMFKNATPNVNLDLAEQVVVSCDSADQGCNGGYMDAVSDFVVNKGIPLESCYPYTATDGSCSAACSNWQSTSYKASSWGYAATVSPTADNIKNALVTYGPLVTTMYVYSDFYYYSSGIYKYTSGSLEGGHAVIIVGYNDGESYFIVKNSWGPEWGESGYFRIAYSELTSKVLFGEETIYYEVATSPTPTECTFSMSPTSASYTYVGGTGTITVTASNPTCAWTAVSSVSWITMGSGSGVGSGSVSYTVATNSSTNTRDGIITVAGKSFTVSQSSKGGGCDTAKPKESGANAIRPWYKFW